MIDCDQFIALMARKFAGGPLLGYDDLKQEGFLLLDTILRRYRRLSAEPLARIFRRSLRRRMIALAVGEARQQRRVEQVRRMANSWHEDGEVCALPARALTQAAIRTVDDLRCKRLVSAGRKHRAYRQVRAALYG